MIGADIAQYFVKDYEQKEFKELADAPVTAIEGLSEGDAEKLQQAFNIKTVRDLAENKFVRVAQAVVSPYSRKPEVRNKNSTTGVTNLVRQCPTGFTVPSSDANSFVRRTVSENGQRTC